MRFRVATLAIAASLAVATPAAADTYTVTGGGDGSIPGGCANTGSGTWSCNSLRGAVQEANANGVADTIVITVPTVTLAVGTLPISSELNIIGTGARQTIIDATGAQAPAFQIGSSATASFTNLTVQRGTGGNVVVLSGSTANFVFTRITGSLSGAGIVNQGTANVTYSLLDANAGGGIDNSGGSQPAAVLVGSTTVANNAAFGIRSRFNAANTVDMIRVTVARNSGAGMSFDTAQDTSINASIIANNLGNCSGGTLDGTFTVEDTNSCGLSPTENRVNADPLLAASLSNQGGQTDVLTIPAGSPAADYLPSLFCSSGFDQRFFTVTAGQPCDAGAYDHEAVDPGFVQPPPTPEPPVPPAPTPQPPAPEPTPVVNRTIVADEVRGTVKVQLPGSKTFVDLDATRGIPTGSIVDTRTGAVELTSVPKAGAPPEKATFYDGLFKVTQRAGITDLALAEELDCPKGKKAAASQKGKKPKKRKLWGDGKGSFRTTGRHSAATVRGTKWLVEDTCTTTTTRVTQGSVTVTDGKKRIVVRAGKRYVARATK